MNPRYAEVALRARHCCEYCRGPEVLFNFCFEVEHILPVVQDGPTSEQNLALACRACNAWKGPRTDGPDPLDQTIVRLFHPREDRWDDHFCFNSESKRIEGITPIGRATVASLRLNDDAHLAARAL